VSSLFVIMMSSASSMGSQNNKTKATSIRLFQKSLRDMITGIRSHKDTQKEFINKCLADIRAEVVSSDIRTKAVAIEKATYLHSLGTRCTGRRFTWWN